MKKGVSLFQKRKALRRIPKHYKLTMHHYIFPGDMVEDQQSVALPGFEELNYQGPAVSCGFEKKFSLVASVGNEPRVSGQEISLGSWHD